MKSTSVAAALCGNMLTVSVLLSVFCLSGAQTQCDKKAAINITAPNRMKALSGSCLQIPCNFSENAQVNSFDGNEKTFGVWIKSDPAFGRNLNNVIFNSSKTQNSYNVEIIGDLKQRNCTTVFSDLISSHADKYFFRIENRLLTATASCHPVKITVSDSAWSPTIELSVDVTKKNSVTVTCSALTPCPQSPPELSWNSPTNSLKQTVRNADGSFATQIQQRIALSDTHDGYNISCIARYPVNGASTVESADSWFYLSCSNKAKPPISSYTRFNNSKHGVMKAATGSMFIYDCDVLEKENSSGQSQTLLISVTVVFVLLCLAFCVWFFRFKHSSPQRTQVSQNGTGEELVLQSAAKEAEEDVHYGDVNFLKKEPGSVSVRRSRQQEEETVYSQVKVSRVENSSTQTANQPEDLYAQVEKH